MKKVLLLLANGFEAYEASVFTDVFGFANTGGADVTLNSAGLTNKLHCAYGFDVFPNKLISEIDVNDYDALAIPGGRRDVGFYDDADNESFLKVIKEFANQNKLIASICVGCFPIAKAGILKDRNATTYFGKKQIELHEFGVIVKNEPIVIDGNIITSSSPSTGLDVAFTLLRLLTDEDTVKSTKAAFGL